MEREKGRHVAGNVLFVKERLKKVGLSLTAAVSQLVYQVCSNVQCSSSKK